MSWVAVGVTGTSMAVTMVSGQRAKRAAGEEAQLESMAGVQRKAAADFEANVLESNATQAIAIGQRNMIDAQRVAKLAESRAQALMAASGGGATSPTALRIIGGIAKEGSYNGMRSLYQGEETARVLRLQAFEKRQEGEFAQIGGDLQSRATLERGEAAELASYGTALGTGGGLYAKYGGRGPVGSGNTDYFQFTGYDSAGGPAYG